MKEDKIKKWMPYIEADLSMAEIGLKNRKSNMWTYLSVIWHCHQVVEKSLKMYIISQGQELLPVHDLPRLLKYTELKVTCTQQDFIYSINKHYITPRYPDLPLKKDYNLANKKLATNYFKESKEFFIWIKKIITEKKAN